MAYAFLAIQAVELGEAIIDEGKASVGVLDRDQRAARVENLGHERVRGEARPSLAAVGNRAA